MRTKNSKTDKALKKLMRQVKRRASEYGMDGVRIISTDKVKESRMLTLADLLAFYDQALADARTCNPWDEWTEAGGHELQEIVATYDPESGVPMGDVTEDIQRERANVAKLIDYIGSDFVTYRLGKKIAA